MHYRASVQIEVILTNVAPSEQHEVMMKQIADRLKDGIERRARHFTKGHFGHLQFEVRSHQRVDSYEHQTEWKQRRPVRFP